MQLDPDAHRVLELSAGGLTSAEVAAHLGYNLDQLIGAVSRAVRRAG